MASSFIKLTHVFDKKQTPVYVNVDQICRVGEESVEEVMGLIREIPSA